MDFQGLLWSQANLHGSSGAFVRGMPWAMWPPGNTTEGWSPPQPRPPQRAASCLIHPAPGQQCGAGSLGRSVDISA